MKRFGISAIAIYLAVSGGVGTVHAQDFPTKPVRIVIGLAPGGSTDTIARLVAQKLSEAWGQNVLVDNRPGAGGTIGADLAAKAQPDGYTLFVGGFGPSVMAGNLYSKLPYDPANDFEHVSLMVAFPLTLVVPASSPVTSVKALIEQAKAKPGALKYGSVGVGSSPHVFIEMMNLMAGTKTIHVPYKGGAPALAGVLAAEVDYAMIAISTALVRLYAAYRLSISTYSSGVTDNSLMMPFPFTLRARWLPGRPCPTWRSAF